MKKVRLSLDKRRSYDILIGHRIVPCLVDLIRGLGLGSDAAIITNPSIYSIHKSSLKKIANSPALTVSVIKIPDTETSKSNRQVVKIIEKVVKADKGKGLFIIAFGGGVVGDVGGFVASIYKRGVPYIQIPTTLLAQVDSAIGGKVAIDLTHAKNLVGAFYQPRLVVSDTNILRSLPMRQVRSGLGEIIKYGMIRDKRLFEFLEDNINGILKLKKESLEHIVYRSAKIKALYVQRDELDTKGIRAHLNFGHTIGHALEAASRYSNLYSHGEAVGIGMIAAARIAVNMGIFNRKDLDRMTALIKKAGLPTRISKKLDTGSIMRAGRRDKKVVRGKNRFILPVGIGRVKIYEDIPEKLICEIIRTLYAR